ncbi:MAG: rRNA maturation RNase YbeY, partial [Candidatus Paceibacterota bacterium]
SWGKEELNHLGEIYLAPDEIKKRKEDIVYLSVHGCLHLLGFNHKKDEEAEEMEKVEKEIMKNVRL